MKTLRNLSLLACGATLFSGAAFAHTARGDQMKKDYVSHAELQTELQAFYDLKKAEEGAAVQKAHEEIEKKWGDSSARVRSFGRNDL